MVKRAIGPSTNLFPMPALLVAVKTGEGQANILTIAWAGIVGGKPPMLALEIGARHYSTPFIEREGNFSANIPAASQAVGADYCGMVSGHKDPNKPATCGWTMAPAAHITSPLIAECPVSFECKVVGKLAAGNGWFYLAEILETHVDERLLGERNRVDAQALDPLIFTPDGYYHRLGERIGQAWQIGAALQR